MRRTGFRSGVAKRGERKMEEREKCGWKMRGSAAGEEKGHASTSGPNKRLNGIHLNVIRSRRAYIYTCMYRQVCIPPAYVHRYIDR